MRVDTQEIDELPPLETMNVTRLDRSSALWQGHRQQILLTVALFVCFAFIYGVSRNRSYTYDGVVFAQTIENPITMLPGNIALEWNHFLWYPTGRAFHLALNSFHVPMRGYESLELLNALIGAAGISVTFLILSRLARGVWGPFAWSALSGFGAVYWARSSGAENYMLGAFWAVCFCYFLLSYWEEPSDLRMSGMAICAVLSAYYHLGNVAMMIATVVAVLIRRFRSRSLFQCLKVGLLFAVLWLPYAYVQHWFEPGGFSAWWLWSKGLADGYAPLQNPTGAFDWAIAKNATATLQTFLRSILWFETWNTTIVLRLGVLVLLGTVAVLYERWKKPEGELLPDQQPHCGYVFLIPLATTCALYAVWQPWNPIYWAVHSSLFFLFAGGMWLQRAQRPVPAQRACFALLIGLVAAHNLSALVLPEKVSPRQFVIDASLRIGHIIPAASPVIMSGRGRNWSYMKVYLPYFAHRKRFSIDLFAADAIARHTDAITWMQDVVASHFDQKIPVFILDDALTGKDGFTDFGLSGEQIESVWRPFKLQPVFDFPGDPQNKLYLVVPPPPRG